MDSIIHLPISNPTIESIMAIKKNTTTIVIISKTGTLSEVSVEPPSSETTLEELTVLLSKKCGYRNPDGFSCYHTYKYKNKKKFNFADGTGTADEHVPMYIYVDVWAKTDGRAGNENKYEMPPPVDEIIFYGNIALVARVDKEHAVNLTCDIWNVIYERLFGGFEDLATTAVEDENEIDELDLVPAYDKTLNGYLKDGFVVDDDSDERPGRRSRKSKAGGGKKNKSESTESEFVTETDTETESVTPPFESPIDSDAVDADADAAADADADEIKHVIEKNVKKKPAHSKAGAAAAAPSKKPTKRTKKQAEEPPAEQESEKELSEEEYL